MANRGALATLDADAALAEIASGTLSKTIAARYGVTPFAVRKRLQQHPDYKVAVQEQAESLVEQATELAMSCDESDVAIARARVDAAHKWAAARDPQRWGQRSMLTVDQRVTVEVVLDQDAAALLGSLRQVSYPQTIEGELPKKEAELAIDLDNQEHSV